MFTYFELFWGILFFTIGLVVHSLRLKKSGGSTRLRVSLLWAAGLCLFVFVFRRL